MLRRITVVCLALFLGFFAALAIAQAVAQPPDVDLKQLAHPALYFGLSGILGMVGHAVKKWARGETASNPLEWFVADHGKSTVAAVGTFAGAVATAALSHQLDGLNTLQLVMSGLTTGFAFDSGINTGAPPPK